MCFMLSFSSVEVVTVKALLHQWIVRLTYCVQPCVILLSTLEARCSACRVVNEPVFSGPIEI